jgi:pyruvate dehydrogenase E2 component (dihydrolipoamide acetyltransferase)
MPRLSDTMSEGTVGKWLKKPGDEITCGEIIAEIETDKATMELQAFESGTLQKILVPEGQLVPIGTPIALIGQGALAESSAPPQASAPAPAAAAPASEAASPAPAAQAATPAPQGAGKRGVEVTMPRLSDTMSEGTVGKWLKKAGEAVADGEIIAEIETDKATMELQAFESGTLQKIVVPEGITVPIGETIAIIGQGAAPAETVETQAEAVAPQNGSQQAPAEGSADRTTAESQAQVQQPTAQPSAPAEPSADGERVKASPVARRLAQERGIDLRQVQGTGPSGRIIKENVDAFQPASAQAPAAQAAAPAAQAPAPAAAPPAKPAAAQPKPAQQRPAAPAPQATPVAAPRAKPVMPPPAPAADVDQFDVSAPAPPTAEVEEP